MIEPIYTNKLDSKYLKPCDNSGTIETFNYTTKNYLGDMQTIIKHVNVYLPYGYSSVNKYNIMYLLHGWTGCAEDFLNNSTRCQLKNILDNMIMIGDCSSLIVVSPTWDIDNQEKDWIESCDEIYIYWQEYINDLIPSLEKHYSTFYNEGEDIAYSMAHRAVGGFSLGGIATWFIFKNACQYQKWYLPMSAECWWTNIDFNDVNLEGNIAMLAKYVKNIDTDFNIYISTGTRDNRYERINTQISIMNTMPEIFTKHKFKFYIKVNGYHAYNSALEYLYNIIPCLFITQ